MPRHKNVVANGPKYKDSLLKYSNSISDPDKKIDFLTGYIYLTSDVPEVLSREEDRALMDVLDTFRAPSKIGKNGNKVYDLATAEKNTRAFIRKKLWDNLELGRKYRQNLSSLPENLENRETIAAYQTRSSQEMVVTDVNDYIYKMLSAGNTDMSSKLRQSTGEDWGEHYIKWLDQETNAFLGNLKGDDLTDYQNGVELLGDEPKMLKKKNPEDVGLKNEDLDDIRKDSKRAFYERYGDMSYRNADLHAALDKFNSKRFWGIGSWWSDDPSVGKETQEHKDLKESAAKLIEANNNYEKVRYMPDVSLREKQRLAGIVMDLSLEVQLNENTYESRKKNSPSSPAGKERLDGAKQLKNLAISIAENLDHYVPREASIEFPDEELEVEENTVSEIKTDSKAEEKVEEKKEDNKEERPEKEEKPAKEENKEENKEKKEENIEQGKNKEQGRNAFDNPRVVIYPEMRSIMFEYASFADYGIKLIDQLQTDGEDVSDMKALKESLYKAAGQKGNEDIMQFRAICEDVQNAYSSFSGGSKDKQDLVNKVIEFQSLTKDSINKVYNQKLKLEEKAHSAIATTKKDYGKVLKDIRDVINSGDNSKELKELETAVLKITEADPKISRKELVELSQKVSLKTADFPEDSKYDYVIYGCLEAENRMNKRFNKRNLEEISSREKDAGYQKEVDKNINKSGIKAVFLPSHESSFEIKATDSKAEKKDAGNAQKKNNTRRNSAGNVNSKLTISSLNNQL